MTRAEKKISDLASILRSEPELTRLSHAELSKHLNAISARNHHKAGQLVPWSKGSIMSPRRKAMKLLDQN